MSVYSANRGPNATQNPPAKIDRAVRCQRCFVGEPAFGGQPVGTLIIQEAVTLITDCGPSVVIGKVMRCPNAAAKKMRYDPALKRHARVCDSHPVFIPAQAFTELGIERANVYRLLEECSGVPAFRLHELHSGEMDRMELPKSIAEQVRPTFGDKSGDPAPAAPSLFGAEASV